MLDLNIFLDLQKMALLAGDVNLPGVGIAPVANAGTPTKVLCLTEVVSAFTTAAIWPFLLSTSFMYSLSFNDRSRDYMQTCVLLVLFHPIILFRRPKF